ncbi:MAG: phage integrase N-terminal SAM-like domain-containing protein [Cetobacterium sp.]|uniref:phage integrase N-terminal SAM-like domain-containing protein n=1 Tax=Cetobacterium sp. TaxID=2071632 RepID=UPI003F2A1F82
MMKKNLLERITLRTELLYRGYATSTQIVYIREVERFLDYINKEVIEITKSDVVRFLNEEESKKDTNTKIVQLNALEFFFGECLGITIAEDINCFKREFKTRRLMTLKECEELIGCVQERERIIYQLVKETKLTISEIGALKANDLLQLDKDYYISEEKISLDLARELYTYLERRGIDEGYIFMTREQKKIHISTIQKGFIENSKIFLKYEFTLKDFKYGVALEMIKVYGEEVGADFLGYKEIKTMRQYFKRIGYVYK